MATNFPGFSGPAASFDEPLSMLSACHERIHRQLATLKRLPPHLQQSGNDQEARTAATNIIRYFDTAAPNHHADEEEDLFPALLESMAGSDAVCLRDLAHSLTAEHRQLELLWCRLRVQLVDVANGTSVNLDAKSVRSFTEAYSQHLQREDDELLPMATRLLGESALHQLGNAMEARRKALDKN